LGDLTWATYVTRKEDIRSECEVLIGKSEGKRPYWRPRLRWEDNIKMNHKYIVCYDVE
jgi:hypothetical protein